MKKENKASGESLVTPVGRLSYPSLFEKRKDEKGDPVAYEASILIPKTESIEKLKAEAEKVAKAAFGKSDLTAFIHHPIKDGDKKDDENAHGHWIITARGYSQRPRLVDRSKEPITDSEFLYPGCYVRFMVEPYSYVSKGNKGVSWGLLAVQFVKDGERFGGGAVNLDQFEDLAEEDVPNF